MKNHPLILSQQEITLEIEAARQARLYENRYHQYCKLTDDVKNYTAEELAFIGESLYGAQWQSNLARDLGLSDARRVRQWIAGERKIPLGIWADIAELVRAKQTNLSSILSKMTTNK